jgi:hypothetical protein
MENNLIFYGNFDTVRHILFKKGISMKIFKNLPLIFLLTGCFGNGNAELIRANIISCDLSEQYQVLVRKETNSYVKIYGREYFFSSPFYINNMDKSLTYTGTRLYFPSILISITIKKNEKGNLVASVLVSRDKERMRAVNNITFNYDSRHEVIELSFQSDFYLIAYVKPLPANLIRDYNNFGH